jgi:phosphatidylglycerol:prolipoprotein diacylglycerol transferase
VSGVFLLGYGCLRICTETFREPDGHIGLLAMGFTMGQMLSIPMVLIGILLLVRARRALP